MVDCRVATAFVMVVSSEVGTQHAPMDFLPTGNEAPSPMGFMPRAASGRVDDPKTGWKGKGLWSDFGSYAGWHIEGGYGTLPKAVKFQMRPNPLAD
jgi:hypothetical protein